MNIKLFFKKKKIKAINFAKQINISPQLLSLYVNYKIKRVSIKLLKLIYINSKGHVDPNSICGVEEWKKELKEEKMKKQPKVVE